jgi:hypothetical protein
MASGIKRKTIYVGTVVAIMAMVSGFALASGGVLLTHHTQSASADTITPGGAITGVAYVSTQLDVTNTVTFTVQTALGTQGTPVTLASGMNVFCMSKVACTEGDPSEQTNYSFDTTYAGAMTVTMFVSYTIGVTTTTTSSTLYVKQASTPVGGNILLVWDLGTATVTVNEITVTLTQCQGASSCP